MQSQLLCRTLSDLPPMPCQLSECCLVFPKWTFKKQNVMWQSFQQSWFTQLAWLHYDKMNNLAHCHTCITAFKQNKIRASSADPDLREVFQCLKLSRKLPRSTIGQQRLNHLMVVHVYFKLYTCCKWNLIHVASDFVKDSRTHRNTSK